MTIEVHGLKTCLKVSRDEQSGQARVKSHEYFLVHWVPPGWRKILKVNKWCKRLSFPFQTRCIVTSITTERGKWYRTLKYWVE